MYLRKSRDNKNDKTLYCQTLGKNSRYKSLYIHAGMDIDTGVYTAGYGGVYEVTWSLSTDDDPSHSNSEIYLYKNFLQMPESILWGAGYGSTSHDFSSRTMYMRLDQFDQIYLNCENCFLVRHINFCVSLVQPDP